jgi:hypothetical protein
MVLTIARKTVAVAFQAQTTSNQYRWAGADETPFVRIMFLVKIADPMAALVFGRYFVYAYEFHASFATQNIYTVETYRILVYQRTETACSLSHHRPAPPTMIDSMKRI